MTTGPAGWVCFLVFCFTPGAMDCCRSRGASIICGTIGGLGIAFTQCLKLLLFAPGNPHRLADLPEEVRNPIIAKWEHW